MTLLALAVLAPAASGQADDGDGLLPPGNWTEEQRAFLLDLIDRTEAALPAFADPSTLAARGFKNFGVTAPGGYDHWTNQAAIDDEFVLDPEHPESLVFRYMPDGGYELQAAMFFLPSRYNMSNIPDDLAWLPGWHTHEELCVKPDGTFAGLANFDGTCSTGKPADMPPMMHVWIVDNACGHRFGGVGVGGLMCDVSGHDHGSPEDPMDHGHDPMDHDHDAVADGMTDHDSTDHPAPSGPAPLPVAPVAQPVGGTPTFTG